MKWLLISVLFLSGCAYRTLEVQTPDGARGKAVICSFISTDDTALEVKPDGSMSYSRKTAADKELVKRLFELAAQAALGAL